MEAAVKLAFDILAFSSIMVLVVAGLAVIASLMGIFNLGHGEFVLLGAYTVYLFRQWGLPEWGGMLLAPFAVASIGLALEAAVIRRMYLTPVIAMLATYAIGLIIRETVRGLIGGQYYSIDEPIPGAFHVAGLNFSRAWGLWALWEASGDTHYRDLYVEHVWRHVAQPSYWAEDYWAHSHWIAQFGVHAIWLSWE